jgi:hypothetical protein
MKSRHVRALGVVIAAGAMAIAASSATAVAAPTTYSSRAPRCAQGVTYRIISPTVARTRTVKLGSTNIRRFPGTGCPLITSVGRGTRLSGTGRLARVGSSLWVEVRGSFGTAWVANSLLR